MDPIPGLGMVRGLGGTLAGLFVAIITVISLAAIYVVIQRSLDTALVAVKTVASSAPPRMVLKPLGNCSGGVLRAVLSVYPAADKPLRAIVVTLDGRNYTYDFIGNNATITLPCSTESVVVVEHKLGTWVYRYELDPTKWCMHGVLVNTSSLLRGCAQPEQLPGGSKAYEDIALNASRLAVKRILYLLYSPALELSWAYGELSKAFQSRVSRAVAVGLVPGYTSYSDKTGIDSIASSQIRRVKASFTYDSIARSYSYHLYRRMLIISNGLIHLEHEELNATVWTPNEHYYNYIVWAKAYLYPHGITFPPITTYNYGWDQSSTTTEIRTDNIRVDTGVIGSIYIPFLVTQLSNSYKLTIYFIPGYNNITIVQRYNHYMSGGSCPLTWPIITGVKQLSNPVYIDVKLHVFSPNSYDPGKIIVEKNYAGYVDNTWQELVQVPYETINLAGPLAIYNATVVEITLSPRLLPRNMKVAIVVLDIRYAAGWTGWSNPGNSTWIPHYAVTGADLYMYIGMEGINGTANGYVLAPENLVPQGYSPEARITRISGHIANYSFTYMMHIGGKWITINNMDCRYNVTIYSSLDALLANLLLYNIQGSYTLAASNPPLPPSASSITLSRLVFEENLVEYYLQYGSLVLVLS